MSGEIFFCIVIENNGAMDVTPINKEELERVGHQRGAQRVVSNGVINITIKVTAGPKADDGFPVRVSLWMWAGFFAYKWTVHYKVPELTKDHIVNGYKANHEPTLATQYRSWKGLTFVDPIYVTQFLSDAFNIMMQEPCPSHVHDTPPQIQVTATIHYESAPSAQMSITTTIPDDEILHIENGEIITPCLRKN